MYVPKTLIIWLLMFAVKGSQITTTYSRIDLSSVQYNNPLSGAIRLNSIEAIFILNATNLIDSNIIN